MKMMAMIAMTASISTSEKPRPPARADRSEGRRRTELGTLIVMVSRSLLREVRAVA
jgi:hypothetical protein